MGRKIHCRPDKIYSGLTREKTEIVLRLDANKKIQKQVSATLTQENMMNRSQQLTQGEREKSITFFY